MTQGVNIPDNRVPVLTGEGKPMEKRKASGTGRGSASVPDGSAVPSPAQRRFLARGLDQPGGKLPLFDEAGQRIDPRTVRACIAHGWAEPWTRNPVKPDWLICRLTAAGRALLERERRT